MVFRGNVRAMATMAVASLLSVAYILRPEQLRRSAADEAAARHPASAASEYLVNSPRCRIPDAEPWDASVRRFFKPSRLLRCSKKPLLTSVVPGENGTHLLRVDQEVAGQYKQRKTDELVCCYNEIARISENETDYDGEADNQFSCSECKRFHGEEELSNRTEFLLVRCSLRRKRGPAKEVYRDGHALVPLLPVALEKLNAADSGAERRLNLLIVGIDSVSRLNLRRTMPATFAFLRDREWVELGGYTKIADNTFPNLMAILTGRTVEELRGSCRGVVDRRVGIDDCPYLWKAFARAGYVTAYGEDTPRISTFNYLRTGFVRQPTDYYLRPFMLAAQEALSEKKFFGLPACVGPVAAVDRIFGYARRFLQRFRRGRHFSLFWMNSLSHNDPNAARNMDARTADFLRDLSAIGTYEDTVVLLLSDHGTRFGDFRHTFLGYYEERLPFIFVWFPARFRERHPVLYRNLLANRRRLTSPFDVHLTLLRILRDDFSDEPADRTVLPACPKCASLLDPIPWDRSCGDAAVADVWCMCPTFSPLPRTEVLVPRLGRFVREVVVAKTEELEREEGSNGSLCASWRFRRVVRAHEVTPVAEADAAPNQLRPRLRTATRLFLVLVEMDPGRTRFEALVEATEGRFRARSSPSRLDGYSKYSECAKTAHLKYYCYCSSL